MSMLVDKNTNESNNNQNFTHISDIINNNLLNNNSISISNLNSNNKEINRYENLNNNINNNENDYYSNIRNNKEKDNDKDNSPRLLLSFGKKQKSLIDLNNIEEKDLQLQIQEDEFSLCNICNELIRNNEIIYTCGCKIISHVSCFVDFMNINGKLINNTCDYCNEHFKIYNFKILGLDYQSYVNNISANKEIFYNPKKGFNKGKINEKDTNINCLPNFEEFCSIAKDLNYSRMSELINISINNSNNLAYDEISHIPLSPIPKNNTPYIESNYLKHNFLQGNSENNNNNTLESKKNNFF
jgi:hypothetical protein